MRVRVSRHVSTRVSAHTRRRSLTHSLTHSHTRSLARRADKVTSVVIPLAMAGTTSLLWARGMLNLYTGSGKLEDQ